MRNHFWILIVLSSCLLAFAIGYNVSSDSGVEPGYFEAPEAGGYGAGAEAAAPEGISGELQDYYKSLSEE